MIALEAISLDELVASAALQTRVDRKYLLTSDDALDLLADVPAVEPGARVLEIGRRRSFGYESVYFDTPDLLTYRLAAHRRRRRFKIRTRTYLDSGDCWLEVKTRLSRGRIAKLRIPHDPVLADHLTATGRDFADAVLTEAGILGAERLTLRPTLTTHYHRSTVHLPSSHARVTIDSDLIWLDCGDGRLELPGHVILETKTGSTPSSVDRLLWRRGHRPERVSKYTAGIATLRASEAAPRESQLPTNRWHRVLDRHFATTSGAHDALALSTRSA